MAYSHFIGFDVSKSKLNYCLLHQGQILQEGQIANHPLKIKGLFNKLIRHYDLEFSQLLCCCENTGLYTNFLLRTGAHLKLPTWLEDPFQLNRSLGRRRDKSDAIDARAIADYAQRFQDKVQLYELPSAAVELLEQVHDLRRLLVKFNQQLKTSLQERQAYRLQPTSRAVLQKVAQRQIRQTQKNIKALEAELLRIIEADQALKATYQLARTVPGMGPVTAVSVIVHTGCFKKVNTAKKCASYAGISPHLQQSGQSLNRSARTAKGHVELKTAFHMGAHCLISHPGPYRDLYLRLRAKNKTYRQAINAVRNKVIRVLYACVKNNQPYDKKIHLGLV